MEPKRILIAGAGPAGLTAAYEALRHDPHASVSVYEMTDEIGGISRTVQYKGNRIDIGGHRFFSKCKRVTDWWAEVMPMQGAPAADDILLGSDVEVSAGGPDPNDADRVMLKRRRVSRIFYLRKFFDYPVSLKMQTFKNMGLGRSTMAALSFMQACLHKRKEESLEDFYINRFGHKLYSMFFEGYTEKVWGLHPSKLGADWGSQRVKGLSVTSVMKDMMMKLVHANNANVETSLIEEFEYPKFGPGQLWEEVGKDIKVMGGTMEMNTAVKSINIGEDRRVKSATVVDAQGHESDHECDFFISSMPIKELIAAIRGIEVPPQVRKVASELPYRDFITVGLLVDKLKIKNTTKLKTYAERIPDTWMYIQEGDVKLGRIQVFNNWSPYMVDDYKEHMWIGLEYFCFEGDKMWNMSKDDFVEKAIDELVKIGVIDRDSVRDSVQIKVKKAYPAYHGAYYDLQMVRDFIDTIPNLYCVGRNGQHRYNNMDHSMLTSMIAIDNIFDGTGSKKDVWSVNTEAEYHEAK